MTATSHPQGSSFGNAINYIYEGRLDEHKDKKEELIMHSDTLRVPRGADDLKGRNRLKSDFISQAEAHKQYGNENRKNYVGHHSLNFSASDMVGLSPKKIEQITGDYIKDAGINQTQYIAVAHQDTDHYHVHIIFNRATDNHTLYNDWREYNKTAERAVALNLKYGFAQEKKQVEMASSPEVLAIRSGHEDIQKLRADELIGRAKNLHHLSKLCEAEQRVFKEENKHISIADKVYRKEDLQAVFYDNRSEDRAKAKQRHIEENTKRKAETDSKQGYEIKKIKIEERKAIVKATLLTTIENSLRSSSSERQFFEQLQKIGIKVTEGQDKRMYIFESSEAKAAMPKYQVKQQIMINTTPPPSELSQTAEPAVPSQIAEQNTGLGAAMAGQKASGGVKKLDGKEEEEQQEQKKKKTRLKMR